MDPEALATYFWQLKPSAAEEYAERLGSSRPALRNHYFSRNAEGVPRPKVIPSLVRICALADATDGAISRAQAINYFTKTVPFPAYAP